MNSFILALVGVIVIGNGASASERAVCHVFANIKVEGTAELQPTKLFTDVFGANSTTSHEVTRYVKMSAKIVNGVMSGRLSVAMNSGYHAYGESDGQNLTVRLEMPDSLYTLADHILGTKTEVGQNLPDIQNLELKCRKEE